MTVEMPSSPVPHHQQQPLEGAPASDGLPLPRRNFAIVVVLLSLVLVVLDGAIANLALPTISAAFHRSARDTVWVVSSYQLAVLISLLPSGALGEILGARRMFLLGVSLFILASALCAFATSLPMLIASRFLQGLGGGGIMALATMNLRYICPQRMLGRIIGINAMVIAISSAAGPGIAGAILSVAQWRWLFAVNLPIGLLILLFSGVLPATPGITRNLNRIVLGLNSLMFALFFLGADQITHAPLRALLMVMASGGLLAGILFIERNDKTPLLPRDLFAARAFRTAVIASVCFFTAQMMSFVALPFFLVETLHFSSAKAGLYLMPWPAAVILIAPLSGELANRVRTAFLCSIGGGLLAAGLLWVAFLPMDHQGCRFIIGTIISGIGFALFQTPNNKVLLLSAPKARSGAAGAMQGTARLAGQTLGAIITALLFGQFMMHLALHISLILAAGLAALAGAISFTRASCEPMSVRLERDCDSCRDHAWFDTLCLMSPALRIIQ
jgi:DHA2 family multidrug resistance protein-like MFS transporter